MLGWMVLIRNLMQLFSDGLTEFPVLLYLVAAVFGGSVFEAPRSGAGRTQKLENQGPAGRLKMAPRFSTGNCGKSEPILEGRLSSKVTR